MIRVDRLIEALQQYPPDALAYAYEGEPGAVIVIVSGTRSARGVHEELGYIEAGESNAPD